MEYNDEVHAKLYNARLKDAENPEGLSQGDIVITEDGKRMRIGHIYEDKSFQLTSSPSFFCEKSEFFFDKPILGKTHLSSGSLDRSITAELEYLGVEEAPCWIWRELPCAGGGIDITMPYRLFKIKSII